MQPTWSDQRLSKEHINVKTNFESARQILESQLKEAAPTQGLRESIRIHQVADPVDLTQQASEREMAMHNLDRDSALMRRIRSAIQRVNDGSYGVCLECEEDIAPKRLKAIPWAELCIQCQETADGQAGRNENGKFTRGLMQAA
jgi:DnaK suppressor protein